MYQFIDYNTIINEDNKTFLIDTRRASVLVSQIDAMTAALRGIVELLKGLQIVPDEKRIDAVAAQGSDGLQVAVLESIEDRIGRSDLPAFVADTWRTGAKRAVPADDWRKADTLSLDYHHAADTLPLVPSDISVDKAGELVVDTEAITERIRLACKVQVTDTHRKEAEQLLEIAGKIKALELAGLNAMELIKKYTLSESTPGELELWKDTITRRHEAGHIYSDDFPAVMNHIVLSNLKH